MGEVGLGSRRLIVLCSSKYLTPVYQENKVLKCGNLVLGGAFAKEFADHRLTKQIQSKNSA